MSDFNFSIILYNETTDEEVEVTVNAEVYVEPTEYEGSNVFYQGGVLLDGYSFEAFTFNGVNYEASKDLPKNLVEYVVDIEDYTSLAQLIEEKFKNSIKKSDFQVPVKRYAAIR